MIGIPYQELGRGLSEDATGVLFLSELGLEMLVCQSFSKSFGLYGERYGAHIAAKSTAVCEK